MQHIADQLDIDAVRAAADAVVQEWGGVDVVFANAGIQAFKPLLEMSDADWHDQIDVNLSGTANVLRVFAPLAGEAGRRPDHRHVVGAGPAWNEVRRRVLGVEVGNHRADKVGGA